MKLTTIDLENMIHENFDGLEVDAAESKQTLFVTGFDGSSISVSILSWNEKLNSIGIHTFPEDLEDVECRLVDSIETAVRDGYPTVFIHLREAV